MVDDFDASVPQSAPVESTPPRRRRAARRPAGPPVHVDPVTDAEPAAEAAGPADEAIVVVEAESVEIAVPEMPGEETPESEGEVETSQADVDSEVETEAEVEVVEPAEEPAEVIEATEPVAPVAAEPRARRSRRATRGVTTVAFSAEPAAAEVPVTPAVEPPPLALFQPPDETKAVRQRRRGRSAKAEAALAAEPSDESVADDQAQAVSEGEQPPTAEGGPSIDGLTDAATDETVADETTADSSGLDDVADDDGSGAPRRRRRRGGRRRRRSGQGGEDAAEALSETDGEAEPETADDSDEAPGDAAEDESAGSRRRRRRRRRAGVSEEMEDLSTEDGAETVVKVREGRRPSDEITSVRGSTRIEAKKQRRRDGRDAGRRRAPILTEAEFLARRESVNRVMCVREHGDRTQIAVLEDGILVEHYVNRVESSSMVGNVYLGKVQNVLPSMEAAFVDVGRGRNAVLYAGEVNWDAAGMEGQPKRIELALKSGDPVLTQVTKDPIGHKGARLTSQISLPGRFLVYVPQGSMTGISRKLPDTERSRLKGILKDIVPEGAGVIVRTAAEGATEEQLTSDVTRLAKQWTDITKKAKSASAPALLYGEPDLAIKVVRDIFNEDFTSLIVQGESTWSTLNDYIGRVAPDLTGKLVKWVEPTDLYTAHRIDEQLAKALDRKVWLPSGGSLVIDRTEAMTVVDVNTGKFTGQGGNLEETVTRNNLEAAEEIVRQLRLRDIGGIIVIDFIDMVLESNRDLVLRRLVECLGRDRTKHQVAEVTSLGLVQMTRKRIGQGLLEVFSTPCEVCGGRGSIVSTEPVGGDEPVEDRGRRSGNDRGRKPRTAPPVHLGGKQTGKTPPPPKFDDHPGSEQPASAAEVVQDSEPTRPVDTTPAETAPVEVEAVEVEVEVAEVEVEVAEVEVAVVDEVPVEVEADVVEVAVLEVVEADVVEVAMAEADAVEAAGEPSLESEPDSQAEPVEDIEPAPESTWDSEPASEPQPQFPNEHAGSEAV